MNPFLTPSPILSTAPSSSRSSGMTTTPSTASTPLFDSPTTIHTQAHLNDLKNPAYLYPPPTFMYDGDFDLPQEALPHPTGTLFDQIWLYGKIGPLAAKEEEEEELEEIIERLAQEKESALSAEAGNAKERAQESMLHGVNPFTRKPWSAQPVSLC